MRRRFAAAPLILVLTGVSLVAYTGGARATESLFGEGESFSQPALQKLQINAAPAISPLQPAYLGLDEVTAGDDMASGVADYAALQRPLTTAQLASAAQKGRTIAYAPLMAGAVGVAFALDIDHAYNGGGRITHLRLTIGDVAKLFTHGITVWNAPNLMAENPGVPLDHLIDENVVMVTMTQSSMMTYALTDMFLHDPVARPLWNTYATSWGLPADTPVDKWPTDSTFSSQVIDGTSETVIDKMLQIDPQTGLRPPNAASHAIGYLSPGWATPAFIPLATLISSDPAHSTAVDPLPDGISKALAATTFDANNVPTIPRTLDSSGAYPATLVTLLAVPTSGLTPSSKPPGLSAFMKYLFSSAGQSDMTSLAYVPVGADLQAKGLALADSVAGQSATTTTSTTSTTSPSTTSTTAPHGSATTTAGVVTSSGSSGGGSASGAGGSAGAGRSAGSGSGSASSGGSSPTTSGGSGLTLPLTGLPGIPILLGIGGLFVVGGDVTRKGLRRFRP